MTLYTFLPGYRSNLTLKGTEEYAALSTAAAAWKAIEGVQRVVIGGSIEENVLVIILGMCSIHSHTRPRV